LSYTSVDLAAMGIKGLTQVISEHAPASMKNLEIKSFFGRKVAIDASMSLYQFLIAVRQNDGQQLQSESGETTSHLLGMFYRTIRIVDNGIKPVYVFDGAPPKLKSGELAKRIARNAQASKDAAEAKETGTVEEIDKFSRRTVRVTRQHNEEAKLLLKLMGIPYVEAPCEAEACCAQLAKSEKVYAAASEDMDTLCFDAPVLLRHLTFSEARKEPISEIMTSKVLAGLDLSRDQFIDMCILLGCDYCDAIRGIGPKKALELIREHGDIEHILETLKDNKKYEVPAVWPYKDARELFKNPDVDPWIRVEMSPLEKELRERMKRNKAAAQEAAEKMGATSTVKNEDTVEPSSQKDGSARESSVPAEDIPQSSAPDQEAPGSSAPAEDVPPSSAPADENTTSSPPATEAPQSSAPAIETTDGTARETTPETESKVDPYTSPVAPKDLSASQAPEIPRIRMKIADLNLEWSEPDVDGLIAFLCDDKGFDPQRVRNGADKLRKATKQKQQGRLDGFFKPITGATPAKRKAPEKKDTKKKPMTKKAKK
jgi:flap endonuclease-1